MTGLRAIHVIGGGDTGGAMSYLLPLLSALRQEGCDAHVLCLGSGGLAEEAERRGLPCEVLPMEGAWDVRVLPGVRRSLLQDRWDVVHTHGMRANLPVRTVFRLARSRPALFTTVHSDLALDYSSPAKRRLYVALDRVSRSVVDGFFCVSADLAARLAARGVPRSRIRVVYPGIEAAPATAPEFHSPIAADEREVVGTVARLVEVKDLGLLLEVAAALRQARPRLKVIVVGDGSERQRLERQTAGAGLTGVVEFRGEVRPVWSALQDFDVYTLTSISEGVPLSVLEAMSVGLPVVSTAVGGLPEIVEDGVTGYLVERGDDRRALAAALAARLELLLADPEKRRTMGRAARSHALQTFTGAAAARQTMRFYERVLLDRSDDGGW